MSDKMKLIAESDAFVEYMHKAYPGLEGLPYRTAMLQAHDFLVGNYHEREKERKKIGDRIQKIIDKNKQ